MSPAPYRVRRATVDDLPGLLACWREMNFPAELLSQEGFQLTLKGEFGVAYQIHGSTNLTGWTLLATVTNDWGTVQFTDPEAATNAHRFYRARSVE